MNLLRQAQAGSAFSQIRAGSILRAAPENGDFPPRSKSSPIQYSGFHVLLRSNCVTPFVLDMPTAPTPSRDNDFDKFMDWLDSDRDRAGEKYEFHRERLIFYFRHWRFWLEAEDMADETLRRVEKKIAAGAKVDTTPGSYIFGFVRYVRLEWAKRPQREELNSETPGPPPDPPDRMLACMKECLGQLPATDRVLVIEYYRPGKHAKAERERLAVENGMTINGLRLRVWRIKRKLDKCVDACMKE